MKNEIHTAWGREMQIYMIKLSYEILPHSNPLADADLHIEDIAQQIPPWTAKNISREITPINHNAKSAL